MLRDLIHPDGNFSDFSDCCNKTNPENAQKQGKKGGFEKVANAKVAKVATVESPSNTELRRICAKAVHGFGIDPDRLRRFLEVADDPAWCTERAARHLARRMSEGWL